MLCVRVRVRSCVCGFMQQPHTRARMIWLTVLLNWLWGLDMYIWNMFRYGTYYASIYFG